MLLLPALVERMDEKRDGVGDKGDIEVSDSGDGS